MDKKGWKPIETAPKGTPFLAAEYAPTNWAYRVKHITWKERDPPRLYEMQIKYCHYWRPLPEDPEAPENL